MTTEKKPEEGTAEAGVPEIQETQIPAKKAKFTPPPFSFGKGAANFNPPNKQRPGHHAGRGR